MNDLQESDLQELMNLTQGDDAPPIEWPANGLLRVEPGDFNQCQATHNNYQCPYRAIGTRNPQGNTWDGPKFCSRHSGTANHSIQKADKRTYMLAKWQERMNHQADNPRIKSLREDIGILRLTLENKFSLINDATELEMRSGGITELVRTIASTVMMAHKIERDSNQLLDKSQALELIHQITQIIAGHIQSQVQLQAIATDMIFCLDKFFDNPNPTTP